MTSPYRVLLRPLHTGFFHDLSTPDSITTSTGFYHDFILHSITIFSDWTLLQSPLTRLYSNLLRPLHIGFFHYLSTQDSFTTSPHLTSSYQSLSWPLGTGLYHMDSSTHSHLSTGVFCRYTFFCIFPHLCIQDEFFIPENLIRYLILWFKGEERYLK
jgi:hypothetical protein